MFEPIKPYFQTEQGKMFLKDSLKVIREVPSNSINLIMTSPPFGSVRKKNMAMQVPMNIWNGLSLLPKSFIVFSLRMEALL